MSKRANGEGTIYFVASRNVYEGQFTYSLHGVSKKKKISAPTKKGVLDKWRTFKADLQNQSAPDSQTPEKTLERWLTEWFSLYIEKHVKVKTAQRYRCAINQHINPYIGNKELSALTSENLQKYLNTLHDIGGQNKQGLAPRTVNSTRRLLSMALDMAVSLKHIQSNPISLTKPLKENKPNMYVLSHQEGELLKTEAKKLSPVAWLTIVLALATGARIGELFGLKWQCVNLDEGVISIERTLVSTNNGPLLQDSGKTKNSIRKIPLSQSAKQALKEYRAWQKEQIAIAQDLYINLDYVLANEFGNHCDPSYFSHKTFKKVLTNAGLPTTIRFHDLRHTHATWLIDMGVNSTVVSERLGHSNIRITLDTYTHVQKGMQDKAIEVLDIIDMNMQIKACASNKI